VLQGFSWVLERSPESGKRTMVLRLRALASTRVAGFPDLAIYYSFDDETVTIEYILMTHPAQKRALGDGDE
jgi:hypothetical protein